MNNGLYNVFVYGLLKKGFRLNYHMGNSNLINNNCYITGYKIYNIGHYPGIKKSENPDDIVKGELYSVDNPTMNKLDEVEEVPLLYTRKEENIYTDKGEIYKAFIYIYNNEITETNIIKDGLWKKNNL